LFFETTEKFNFLGVVSRSPFLCSFLPFTNYPI
jgi:hypothetical protein